MQLMAVQDIYHIKQLQIHQQLDLIQYLSIQFAKVKYTYIIKYSSAY